MVSADFLAKLERLEQSTETADAASRQQRYERFSSHVTLHSLTALVENGPGAVDPENLERRAATVAHSSPSGEWPAAIEAIILVSAIHDLTREPYGHTYFDEYLALLVGDAIQAGIKFTEVFEELGYDDEAAETFLVCWNSDDCSVTSALRAVYRER